MDIGEILAMPSGPEKDDALAQKVAETYAEAMERQANGIEGDVA